MRIKKLRLNNIRSYVSEEIDFPEGSILLAGDIGAGKSTILLAIDFALFGLQKGNIQGSSLLRNGEDKGTVELNLIINENDIIIKRGLKKEGSKIIQDSGELVINNEKTQLTATELKLKILGLLNYPKELLTKSKSLIYRYTVYTPQEEMKQILLSGKEERLDILRKIFGIDKYKRIKDNSKIFVSNLKLKKKECEGIFLDLTQKQNLKKEKEEYIKELNKKLEAFSDEIFKSNEEISVKRFSLEKIEKDLEQLRNLKEELYKTTFVLDSKIKQMENNDKEIKGLKGEIKLFDKKECNIEDLNNKINSKETELGSIEKEINNLHSELRVLNYNSNKSLELKEKIENLDLCPTCMQKVGDEHKDHIKQEETKKVEENNKKMVLTSELKEEKEKILNELRLLLNKLKREKQDYEMYIIKKDFIMEREKKLNELLNENKTIEENIMSLKNKKEELQKQMIFEGLENNYNTIKKELKDFEERHRSIELNKRAFESELIMIKKIISELEYEIGNKIKAKDKFLEYSKLHNWLEEEFFNLVDNMERQIMFKVHSDFNELFKRWSDILINNELITVRLDENFTPVIEQNGYDLEYDFISGGERTSIALSYRLALNQVINNLITTIKTKDLLILDEPTDGFSSEQLDRLRVVLEELNLKQTIIISHDPKIESFVENVIKVNKKGYTSYIES